MKNFSTGFAVSQTSHEDKLRTDSYFLEHVWKNVNEKDQNFLMIVIGKPGSGKSWSSLKMAEKLDPNFTIQNVVFSTEEFIQRVASNPDKGSVIIYDEVGAGAGSRRSMTKKNQIFSDVMQTFRHQNLIVFFTAPSARMVDRHVKMVAHAQGTARGTTTLPNGTVVGELDLLGLEWDDITARLKTRHFRLLKDGVTRVTGLRLAKPSPQLLKDYLAKKKDFTTRLNEKSLRNLGALEMSEDLEAQKLVKEEERKKRLRAWLEEHEREKGLEKERPTAWVD